MRYFKQLVLSAATFALMTLTPETVLAAPSVCEPLNNYRYLNLRDDGPGRRARGYVCVVVRDSPDLQGVLTLKHLNQGNWDVLVGTSFDPNTKTVRGTLNYQNNTGSADELVRLPGNSNREYVVVAFPQSNTPSNACLIFHRFDTAEVLGQAFVETAAQNIFEYLVFGPNASQETKNNTARVMTLGQSILTRNNLGQVGYDLMLNEISTQLANTFGGGSWLFDLGVNYFGSYLEESGRFLFDRNMRCRD